MEGFWDFSVRTYRTSGVPEACLSLQNQHGADINMLLFCIWSGAACGEFDAALFERANAFSVQWANNVVISLRNARIWMKQTGCNLNSVSTESCMALREDIKSAEFAAEKMQQEVLESMASVFKVGNIPQSGIMEHVAANVMLYLQRVPINVTEEVRDNLSVIVRAGFPDLDEKTVTKALEVAA